MCGVQLKVKDILRYSKGIDFDAFLRKVLAPSRLSSGSGFEGFELILDFSLGAGLRFRV